MRINLTQRIDQHDTLMRSLGQEPKQSDLKDIVSSVRSMGYRFRNTLGMVGVNKTQQQEFFDQIEGTIQYLGKVGHLATDTLRRVQSYKRDARILLVHGIDVLAQVHKV